MRWDDFGRSSNVEDDRDGGPSGGGFQMPGGRGGLGIGTVLVLGIVGYALGIDPRLLIEGAGMLAGGNSQYEQQQQRPREPARTGAPADKTSEFVSAILKNTEDVWNEVLKTSGEAYREPKLRLFAGQVQSACGTAGSATGPFYCPGDGRIYLDTSFFRDLETRFRGCPAGSKSCEFAQAYVIAHEVGHHVQNVLGILGKVQQAQKGSSKVEANRLQVRVELQADCFAGVWAHHSNQRWKSIEPGDVEAAMQTAAAIGDDRLQKQSTGTVVPDSFTHGSSAQRQRWFSVGLKDGKVSSCNTFAQGVSL
jgi:predicted metalloprotease